LPRVGPYQLLEVIGEGGMGRVYLARQDAPIRRDVALKLVRRGLDTDRIIARFETERQTLALMDHPGIAKVFDAGASEDGRPYFVMERVQGSAITHVADARALTVHQRLELFLAVCRAVQHAHQKGVIHRDLKPSNVLVAEVDGGLVPKIIDFGIAKVLDQSAPAATFVTEPGHLVGTPEYLSPEQAGVLSAPVDTRTDVYALGAVLYELLTGGTPHELDSRSVAEVRRVVGHATIVRPSARVATAADTTGAAIGAAACRGTSLSRLRRELAGDLDNIVLKALQSDPADRYSSVERMADDIRRYLDGRPVEARAAAWTYRTRKFVRRHALGVGAAAALVLAVASVAVIMTIQAARLAAERDAAERERATAAQVSQFMQDLFKASDVADPLRATGREVTAREILDRGVQRIQTELKAEPAVQAELMDTMAEVYIALALFDQATPLVEQALALRRERFGSRHVDTAESVQRLCTLRTRRADFAAAEALCREALDVRQALLDPFDARVAYSLNDLAGIFSDRGRHAEAIPLYEQALAIRRKTLGPEHPYTATIINNLGLTYFDLGDYAKSEPLQREGLALRRKAVGDDSFEVAVSLNNLATLLEARGNYAEAEPLFRRSLDIRRAVLAPDHPSVANAMSNLGRMLGLLARYDEAEPLLVEALDLRRTKIGVDQPETASSLAAYGRMLLDRGELQRSEPLLRQALEIVTTRLGTDHQRVVPILTNLGRLLRTKGDEAGAGPLLERAVAVARAKLGTNDPVRARALLQLAQHHLAANAAPAAVPLAEEGAAILRRAMMPGTPDIGAAETLLAAARAR
jgi:tetratricopeptide (TPR) repeat protein